MTAEGRTPLWGNSLSWQGLNVLLQVVLQLIYIRILAELLTKEDFGIMAISLIVVGVVEIFAQVGIGPSVVQYSGLTSEHKASAGGSVQSLASSSLASCSLSRQM